MSKSNENSSSPTPSSDAPVPQLPEDVTIITAHKHFAAIDPTRMVGLCFVGIVQDETHPGLYQVHVYSEGDTQYLSTMAQVLGAQIGSKLSAMYTALPDHLTPQ